MTPEEIRTAGLLIGAFIGATVTGWLVIWHQFRKIQSRFLSVAELLMKLRYNNRKEYDSLFEQFLHNS